MRTETGTMQPVSAQPAGPPSAGLVLLYADPLDAVPSTVPLTSLLTIGREPGPGGLRVMQSSASRLHAKIASTSEGWCLGDLGSRNGTFVDGRRVTGDVLLRDGAEIRIGDTLLKFVAQDIDAYGPYRIDGSIAPGAHRRSTAIPELVGGMRIDRVAASIESVARADVSVLVLGETGTGKEVVAQALHRLSGRPGDLCAINCAAVPANLFESELFGVCKGAFTGADRDRTGIVKAADRGTLFLDEIGDMPLEVQAKLLRVLEAREVRVLGATKAEPIDVRIISATHRDLTSLVAEGRFRGDLLARIRGYDVALPPLRARKEDLYQLVRHFLARAGRSDLRPTFGFMAAMCDYDWPFNVRECEAAVRRAAIVANANVLDVAHLPEALQERAKSYGARPETSERGTLATRSPKPDELRALLARHGGNVAAVARELGRDRTQVHRWMRRYGITPGGYRE